MSVQNGICTSEVFQIEISDGSGHRFGSCQNINLYPARVFTGTRFLGVRMRLQITPIRIHNSIFIGEVFLIEAVLWRGS